MEPGSHTKRTGVGLAVLVFAASSILIGALSGAAPSGRLASITASHAARWLLAVPIWLVAMVVLAGIARRVAGSLASLLTVAVPMLLLGLFGVQALVAAVFGWVGLPASWLDGQVAAEVASALVVAGLAMAWVQRWPALRQSRNDEFLEAAERSLDDLYLLDTVNNTDGELVDFRFHYVNPNVERRLRMGRDQLIGRRLTEVRPWIKSSDLLEQYRKVMRTGEPFSREIFFDDELIRATWIQVLAVKAGDRLAITSRDVTDNKRRADHVNYLAHYDQLTGLPNRTLLEDRLSQAIVRAQRQGHKVAVFVIDVDEFKEVNDTFGHAGGDELLVVVSRRLRSCMRESDTVARLGGDEFVVVMPDFKTLDEVKACGLQLVRQTAQPLVLDGREVAITISVGVCLYPDLATDVRQLLKNADSAMYAVKSTGRNGLNVYTGSAEADDVVA